MKENEILSIDSLTANSPKQHEELFVWTDYCELLCLANKEEISLERIAQTIQKSWDFQPKDSPRNADAVTTKLTDAFSQMKLRKALLKGTYPFLIDKNTVRLQFQKKNKRTNIHYIFLLLASNLTYVKKGIHHKLTSGFEKICLDSLQYIFPNAKVKLFGASNKEPSLSKSCKFKHGKLKDRIVELSTFIGQPYQNEIEVLKDNNVGDNGLDVIGVISLGDQRGSRPLLFVQCACSKDEWTQKQHTTSRSNWQKWLKLYDTSIQNFIMVPFWYMDNSKDWVDSTKITQNIMIDRLRLMKTIKIEESPKIDLMGSIENVFTR